MAGLDLSPEEISQRLTDDSNIKSNNLDEVYSSLSDSGEKENVICPNEDFFKIENVEEQGNDNEAFFSENRSIT